MNLSAATTGLVPPGVVTVMSTVPDPDGTVALIWVSDTTEKPAAGTVPKTTPVAPVKPVPVMVTDDAAGPEEGLTPDTLGTGGIGLMYAEEAAGVWSEVVEIERVEPVLAGLVTPVRLTVRWSPALTGWPLLMAMVKVALLFDSTPAHATC